MALVQNLKFHSFKNFASIHLITRRVTQGTQPLLSYGHQIFCDIIVILFQKLRNINQTKGAVINVQ